MTEKNLIKYVLCLLGFHQEKNKPRTVIFRVTSAIMLCGTIVKVYKTWNANPFKRFTAIKDLSLILSFLLVHLEMVLKPQRVWSLLKIIDKDFNRKVTIHNGLNTSFSDEKINAIVKTKKTQTFDIRVTFYIISIVVIVSIFLPQFIILYIYFTKKDGDYINYQEVPLPMEFWIPEKFRHSRVMFLVIDCLSSVNITLGAYGAFIILGTFRAALRSIVTDLKLYCISLKEIDKYCLTNSFNYEKYNTDENGNKYQDKKSFYIKSNFFKNEIDLRKLKSYINFLVVQHTQICRDMANVNRFVQLSITAGNQCIFFQVCLYLYLSNKGNNNLIKTGCICLALMACLVLYLYCNDGQKLIDEYDELRRCLGECSWVDKPQWFKKMLLTMMIRSTAPFNIKPFGLYIINLDNFVNILKASYSYYNLIQTIK